MERRKFVIGLGALATGSAAAMGTGAFSSVSANRDVAVTVSDDSDSFLSLIDDGGDNTDYASYESGVLSLDLSGDSARNGQDGSEGLNKEASTTFLQLFKIRNSGTNTVGVKVSQIGETGDDEDDDFQSMGWFVGDEHNAQDDTTLSGDDIADYDWDSPDDDLRILDPGEDVWVGAYFLNPNFDGSETYTAEISAHDEKSATANNV